MKNKIYAIQVDPQYQDSHFELECWPGVVFSGNRDYIDHIPDEYKPIFDRFPVDRIRRALELFTGRNWSQRLICGCVQSEWQYVYYPSAEYSREAIQALETEYFNTGSEWGISTGAPDDPNAEIGYYLYCSTGNVREEIAQAEGVPAENVILYRFAGYSKTPIYKEV